MNRIYSLIFLMCCSVFLTAQDARVNLNIMPLSLINLNGRLRLGIEIEGEKMSYCLDLEYGNDWTRIIRRNDLGFNFYGIRPEIRYKVGRNNKSPYYIGLEIPMNFLQRKLGFTSYENIEGIRMEFTNGTMTRERASLLFKIGSGRLLGNRLTLNYYFGIGAAYRNIEYKDRLNSNLATTELDEGWGLSSDASSEGSKFVPDLALGIRIGLFVGKSKL